MALITDTQRSAMLAAGQARARGDAADLLPIAKFYTPDADACWLLASLDADGDCAFGLIDAGTGFPELGEVSLSMLESIRGPQGLAVAAEPDFQPRRTLSAYLADAQRGGAVTD